MSAKEAIEDVKQRKDQLELILSSLDTGLSVINSDHTISWEKYRFLAENMADVIWIMDMNFQLTYVSPSVKKMLGYSPEERMKQPLEEQVTPASLKHIMTRFEEELTRDNRPGVDPGRAMTIDVEYYHKDGSTVWVENNIRAIRNSDGEPIGMHGVSRNISDRKRIEKDLKKSEENYRQLIEGINEVVYSVDEKGFLNYISPAVKGVLGYDPEDITGKNYCILIHPEDKKLVTKKFQEALSGKLLPDEYRVMSKSGGYRWVRSSSNPNYENGRPSGLKGVLLDITEEKRLQHDLQLSQKMESIGALAGGIAHEFNNMLSIMIGNAELAIEDIPDQNPVADYIQEIRTAGLRAKDVVSKLLSVAQKIPAVRKPLQISTVVGESLNLLRKTIPTTIEFKSNLTCTTEQIMGDPTELSQILINLCTNAVHAMSDKTGVLEVNLETIQLDRQSAITYQDLKPGDYARLTVRDSGDGIEPNLIDRVFEPYFTTKDVDKGLGMGLAVVYGIVTDNEGGIKIDSEVGKGTTVDVLFPLIEEQAVTSAEKTDTPPTGTERILFVDDEPALVKIGTQMLERSGYDVVAKTSSPEALKTFKEASDRFDLVITDMAMPEMGGDRLAQEITRIRPDIPILLCTGYSDQMNENRAKEVGINLVIMKPTGKAILTKAVRKLLDATNG